MKAVRGFSPLSVVTLVVAAVWLPIVLFPYGGAILMNIVFIYGFREYRANKGEDIFRIFTWITAFTCALFLLIALVVPFEPAYRLLREVALIGPMLREDLPSGQALTVFQWVILGALLCTNPYMTYSFGKGVVALGAPLPRQMLVRMQNHAGGFAAVSLSCLGLIMIQMGYLAGVMDNFEPRERGLHYRIAQILGIGYSALIPLLALNFLTFGALTLFAFLRAHAKDIVSRK